MLSAFKPTKGRDATKPVVIVATRDVPGEDQHISEACFVYAKDVETALFKLAARQEGPHISEWIRVKDHASIQEALAYGEEVAKAFQYKELADTKGFELYSVLYGLFCPKHMKV